MRLGIMQPYFFPYIGHFSLIASVDKWVVFDITQYTPRSWMNRNRILHPTSGWQYISVPLSNSSRSIKAYEARIKNLQQTRVEILGKLEHYKKQAPYYQNVIKLVESCFERGVDDSLVKLNANSLNVVCEYLGVPFSYQVCSELSLTLPDKMGPGDWAPTISEQLGASEYLNPIAGRDLFEHSVFQKHGIELLCAESREFKYETSSYQYESNLSILDVLMWNSPEILLAELKQGANISKVR